MKLNKLSFAILILGASSSTQLMADDSMLEEVLVLSKKTTFANNAIADEMKDQQNSITSVLAVVDNVPGVLINEGDVFGSDDWSTTISIRGFQTSLDEQQIGMTVDGIPNGNSNYGGGSKANRFIDTENLLSVNVSQGTADIASRSHEALGGTLDFITDDPSEDERMRFSITSGDYDAKKIYARYDTGEIWGNTKAYFSYSDSDVKAWIDESGESNRNHIAFKVKSMLSWADITSYVSYDETHEDNYQRVSAGEFRQNPDWDRLTGDWTGTPYVDQLYRRGWSTLRENLLGYVRFEFDMSDNISAQVSPYYHKNEGRGDWLPPYIANVTDDGTGNPESELTHGNTVYGGSNSGVIGYVDRDGVMLAHGSDCASMNFPYGGSSNDDPNTPDQDESSNLHLDPACYPSDAIPVGSYRHTHYEKERFGITGDIDWALTIAGLDNVIRAGFWYEDQTRYESRDWHKVLDSRSSYHFDHTPYWVQYDRSYPQTTMMYYIEDGLSFSAVSFRFGVKQWYVDVERADKFTGAAGSAKISSDSDLLLNAGVLWQISEPLEVFAGYAENYAAIKDVVLEAANVEEDESALDGIEPETAENTDIGIRYNGERFAATATVYQINFENRITFVTPDTVDGIDFLEEQDGKYVNYGGIESSGIELSLNYQFNDNLSSYFSYTQNDSTYLKFNEGNTVFGSAEDMYVISLDWQKDAYRAGFTTKHVGERWLDAANTSRIDAYEVADIYVAVTGDNWGNAVEGYELRFTVNNVFNEDYIGGVAGGWGGWIGGGRTAAFNLKLDF